MKFNLYAVRDSLLGYSMPFIRDNDAVAIRAFEYDYQREDSPYTVHPEHFVLYNIGTYDTETAETVSLTPVIVCCASDFVKEK